MNTDEVRQAWEVGQPAIMNHVIWSEDRGEYVPKNVQFGFAATDANLLWDDFQRGYQQATKESEAEIERLKKELNDDRTFWDIGAIAWNNIKVSMAKNQTEALALYDAAIKKEAINDFEDRIIEKAKEFNLVEVFTVVNHVRRAEALKEADR